MEKFGEIYKKYGKHKIDLPFRECWFCETIEDCPHPTVNEKCGAVCPDECVRKEEITLLKKR